MSRSFLCTALSAALAPVILLGQPSRPTVTITPNVEPAKQIRSGSSLRVSAKVVLPRDVHVQSNKPREAALIPTVLTLGPMHHVSVAAVHYPKAIDLAQAGRQLPLAVYGPEFSIEVDLVVAPDAPAGALTVPAQLRYQACNDTVCFPPARASFEWRLTVTSARATASDPTGV